MLIQSEFPFKFGYRDSSPVDLSLNVFHERPQSRVKFYFEGSRAPGGLPYLQIPIFDRGAGVEIKDESLFAPDHFRRPTSKTCIARVATPSMPTRSSSSLS